MFSYNMCQHELTHWKYTLKLLYTCTCLIGEQSMTNCYVLWCTVHWLSFLFLSPAPHTHTHRVMEEIDEVVGDKTSVEADDLDKLTYTNQVKSDFIISSLKTLCIFADIYIICQSVYQMHVCARSVSTEWDRRLTVNRVEGFLFLFVYRLC